MSAWPSLALLLSLLAAPRDEGMWLFNEPPLERLANDHGFRPDAAWFDRVREASVRFNSGGSGSFVSADGLVLTNHHVALESIQKLSTEERDLVKGGFDARSRAEELRCPDLELNVLVAIEDVTARVQGAVKAGVSPKEANEARKAETARIEKEETERTGLRCDVVSLYQGGAYHLYRYRKHTDVRLVFAPEQQVAFFGGDPDNFTYPRYCLDFALLRVYEGDRPYRPAHYLPWSAGGAKQGDLVFVSGNPGSTGRLQTLAQLEYFRDVQYPQTLRLLHGWRDALREYSARGEEAARRAKDDLFSYENSIKAITGYLGGLRDPRVLERKTDEERRLREALASQRPTLAEFDAAIAAIAEARAKIVPTATRSRFSRVPGSLGDIALNLVRLTAELEKPNEDRLPEYRDSALESLRLRLFSSKPIYLDLEESFLAEGFRQALGELGADDPFVKTALGGRGPQEAAAAAVRGTGLVDPEARRRLAEGGTKAIGDSRDPMIALARAVDPHLRALRKTIEDELDSVETVEGERLSRARFRAFGKSIPPDATFTLRLSYGVVRGYEEGTTRVPFKTTLFGLYDRHASMGGEPPFDLPGRWSERPPSLDLSTPINFVCTADIIGGNSGSPVIDREGRLVGVIFDGNIQSLSNRFVYDDAIARAVSVHSAAMLEALRKVYDADALADELENGPGR